MTEHRRKMQNKRMAHTMPKTTIQIQQQRPEHTLQHSRGQSYRIADGHIAGHGDHMTTGRNISAPQEFQIKSWM